MELRKITEICLELEYGRDGQKLLKEYLNEVLNNGIYYEGFESAVYKRDLDFYEFEDLVKAFKSAYREDLVNIDEFSKILDQHLPQSFLVTPTWLVADNGDIYISDSLRVAKIRENVLQWVTKQISYDGIILESLASDNLTGRWYDATKVSNPWKPLKISLKDGQLISGKIVEN